MPPVGFEPTIPASERLQTHTLDRLAVFSLLYFVTMKIGKYNRLMNVEKKLLRNVNIPVVWDVTPCRPIKTDVSNDRDAFIFRISQFMIRPSKTRR
jgi:hypothetical protein